MQSPGYIVAGSRFAKTNDILIPMPLSPEQTARLKTAAEQAVIAETETGFAAEVIIAQWALESGWGKSQPGNNCFGHKAPAPMRDNARRQLLTTKEWFNQPDLQRFLALGDGRTAIEDTDVAPRNGRRRYTVRDWFMKYASLAEAFSKHANKLQQGRYEPAWRAFQSSRDPIELARAIHRAGYATAPDYADILARIIRNPEVQSALGDARAATQPADTPDVVDFTVSATPHAPRAAAKKRLSPKKATAPAKPATKRSTKITKASKTSKTVVRKKR